MLLRRALIGCASPDASVSDLEDGAELALLFGEDDVARMLWTMAFLVIGFSPVARRRHYAIAKRTGLWDAASWMPIEAGTSAVRRFTDRAIDELAQLERAYDGMSGEGYASSAAAPDIASLLSTHFPGEGPPKTVNNAARVGDIADRLFEAMQAHDNEVLSGVLADVHELIVLPPAVLVGDYLSAGLEELATAVVVARLRDFFSRYHDLCWPPLGSAALFASAARLSVGGLGPYLNNVGRSIRGVRDLFGLARLAAGSDANDAGVQRWLVVLATDLDGARKVELADEAGDRGMTMALFGLLATACRESGHDRVLVTAIRDAGLDLGDLTLAVRAQAEIVRWAGRSSTEWSVLGEILATRGDTAEADATFLRALQLSPNSVLAAERLAALRKGRFGPFETLHGFGSLPGRVAFRGRHRLTLDH